MEKDTTTSDKNAKSNASFRQKSTGVSLVIISSIALYYFSQAYGLMQTGAAMPDGALQLAVFTVIGIILVEAVMQIVLAIGAGQVPNPTRRDRDVSLRAKRNAYVVLILGVLFTFGSAFFGATPFIMANLGLFALILAEIVNHASQLIYYPRTSYE